MKSALVWFAIVYGNLNAMVVLAVMGALWVEEPSGRAFCSKISLDIFTCRVSIVVSVVALLGVSTVLSIKRLLSVRRSQSKGGGADSSG